MTDDAWLLVFPHRDRLVRLARRRLDSLADAEDIASEAMLRVATFPALDHGRVGEMLTSVTVRLCTDLLRHRAVVAKTAPRLHEVPADPLAVLLDTFEARWLAEVPLTKVERALLMARVHGLYPSEVAASLGLTGASAKMALERARRKIVRAWTATLGVLGFARLRRLLPAGAVAVTALAVMLAPLLRAEQVPATVAQEAPEPPERAVVRGFRVSQDQPPPSQVDITLHVEPPAVPEPRPALGVPPLDGPVWHRGIRVTVDDSEDPVSRVQRCLRNGIAVTLSTASLTCRE